MRDSRTLTVLTTIFSTQDGQAFTDRRPNHERVRGTQAVLVRLCQRKLLKVQPKLADVGLLLDRDLTCVCPILSPRIGWVDEDRLVLVRDAATRELEGTAGAEAVSTWTDGCARTSGTLRVRQTGSRVAVVSVTRRVLEPDDVQDSFR